MIYGEYVLNGREWCLRVNGKVHPGDTVTVVRRNGVVHKHKVAEVIMTAKKQRLCTIVPVARERLKEVYG